MSPPKRRYSTIPMIRVYGSSGRPFSSRTNHECETGGSKFGQRSGLHGQTIYPVATYGGEGGGDSLGTARATCQAGPERRPHLGLAEGSPVTQSNARWPCAALSGCHRDLKSSDAILMQAHAPHHPVILNGTILRTPWGLCRQRYWVGDGQAGWAGRGGGTYRPGQNNHKQRNTAVAAENK